MKSTEGIKFKVVHFDSLWTIYSGVYKLHLENWRSACKVEVLCSLNMYFEVGSVNFFRCSLSCTRSSGDKKLLLLRRRIQYHLPCTSKESASRSARPTTHLKLLEECSSKLPEVLWMFNFLRVKTCAVVFEVLTTRLWGLVFHALRQSQDLLGGGDL